MRNVPVAASEPSVTMRAPTVVALSPATWRPIVMRLVLTPAEVDVADVVKTSLVAPTVTVRAGLSVPRQSPIAGVTVYFHVPSGTLLSVQVSALMIPEHVMLIVCSVSVAS